MSAPPRDALIFGRFTRSEVAWIALSILIVIMGADARIHNSQWSNALMEPDGNGHALHVFAWYDGRLPDPRSWAGFNPPLYYLMGAGLWHLLPDSMPVHVALRYLSGVLGAAAVILVWWGLRRSLPLVDATAVAVLAWCIPFVVMVTSSMGGETLGALLVTALLIRMMQLPEDDDALPLHALGTGLLAGVGMLAKSSSLVALGAAGLTYLIRLRAKPARAIQVGAITAVAACTLAAPHYVRLALISGGSPMAAFSAAEMSPEVRAVMAAQPPGKRSLSDYVSLPAATLLDPSYNAPGMTSSIPGLLYASTWADAHGGFLSIGEYPQLLRAQVWMGFAGLLPTALLFLGAFRVARNFGAYSAWMCPMIFLNALFIAFMIYSWQYPTYATIKARYMLPALLPLSFLVGEGLMAAAPPLRGVLRAAILAIAFGASKLTWWGWWFPE